MLLNEPKRSLLTPPTLGGAARLEIAAARYFVTRAVNVEGSRQGKEQTYALTRLDYIFELAACTVLENTPQPRRY